MDLKLGRQINTWGTGDLLFINDLFPKDWNAFFIGRDDEYLKAPADSAKASLFSDWANLDLIYSPRFDSDRFIDGRRISYWNGALGRTTPWTPTTRRRVPRRRMCRPPLRSVAYEIAASLHRFLGNPARRSRHPGAPTFRAAGVRRQARAARSPAASSASRALVSLARRTHGDDPFAATANCLPRRLRAGLMPNLTAGSSTSVEQMQDYGAYPAPSPPARTPRTNTGRS
jgi:hypothetical protein